MLVQCAACDQGAAMLFEGVAAGAGQPDDVADGDSSMLVGKNSAH
jgi:hypothetical protein